MRSTCCVYCRTVIYCQKHKPLILKTQWFQENVKFWTCNQKHAILTLQKHFLALEWKLLATCSYHKWASHVLVIPINASFIVNLHKNILLALLVKFLSTLSGMLSKDLCIHVPSLVLSTFHIPYIFIKPSPLFVKLVVAHWWVLNSGGCDL